MVSALSLPRACRYRDLLQAVCSGSVVTTSTLHAWSQDVVKVAMLFCVAVATRLRFGGVCIRLHSVGNVARDTYTIDKIIGLSY